MKDRVLEIKRDSFRVRAEPAEDCLTVKLVGNGDMDTTAALTAYLKQVHEEATEASAKAVVLDCSELYFLSSACIKCLVTWLERVKKLEGSARYEVRFVMNSGLHWQRRSFAALKRFAPEVVSLEG